MTMDQIILGNIYTLDRKVEAVCVKDGIIQYAGSKRVALQLIDENTEILDCARKNRNKFCGNLPQISSNLKKYCYFCSNKTDSKS